MLFCLCLAYLYIRIHRVTLSLSFNRVRSGHGRIRQDWTASDVIAWTDVSRRRLSNACCSCASIYPPTAISGKFKHMIKLDFSSIALIKHYFFSCQLIMNLRLFEKISFSTPTKGYRFVQFFQIPTKSEFPRQKSGQTGIKVGSKERKGTNY